MEQKRLTSNYPLVRCSMFDFSKNYVGPTRSGAQKLENPNIVLGSSAFLANHMIMPLVRCSMFESKKIT